jgi:hypothetical protein
LRNSFQQLPKYLLPLLIQVRSRASLSTSRHLDKAACSTARSSSKFTFCLLHQSIAGTPARETCFSNAKYRPRPPSLTHFTPPLHRPRTSTGRNWLNPNNRPRQTPTIHSSQRSATYTRRASNTSPCFTAPPRHLHITIPLPLCLSSPLLLQIKRSPHTISSPTPPAVSQPNKLQLQRNMHAQTTPKHTLR